MSPDSHTPPPDPGGATAADAFAEVLPFIILAPVGLAFVSIHLSQIVAIPFATSARIAVIALLLACAAAVVWSARQRPLSLTGPDHSWLGLAGAGGVFAVLGFVLVRWNPDDTHYISNAVYFLAHPNTPMGFETYYIHVDDGPFRAISWINSYTVEFLLAAVARVFDLSFHALHWSAKTVIAGFLIPLAWYGLLRRFQVAHAPALAGIGLTLLVVFVMGETINAYGNWFLTRLFFGKGIVIALGLPLIWSHVLAFLDSPSGKYGVWHGAAIAATATAMIGMSTMAGFILPASAACLIAAHGLVHGPRTWLEPRRFFGLLAAFGYLIAVTVYIRLHVDPLILDNDGVMNSHYPKTYLGQLSFITDPGFPLSAAIIFVATLIAVIHLRGTHRRVIGWWCLIYAGIFINPITAPLFIEHLTTANAYWRLFHAYPVPLVIGISAVAGVARWHAFDRRRQILSGVAVGALLAAPHVLLVTQIAFGWDRTAPSLVRSVHRISAGGPRISDVRLADVQAILRLAPPGPMLAAHPANSTIPMFSGRHPQIHARDVETLFWFDIRGERNRGQRRYQASRFAGGLPRVPAADFFQVIAEEPNLKTLVMRPQALAAEGIASRISAAGFENLGRAGRYVIFARRP